MVRSCCCVVNETATTEIYTDGHTLSLPDALPICRGGEGQGSRHRRDAGAAQLAHRARFQLPPLGFRPPSSPPTVSVTPVTRPVTALLSPSGVPPVAPPVTPLVTCDSAPVAVATTLPTSATGVPAAPPAKPPVSPPVSPPVADRRAHV